MITVNSEEHEFNSGMTIAALLEELKYVLPHIIVRHNGKLVARSDYDRIIIEDNDVIDAIHPMVGG